MTEKEAKKKWCPMVRMGEVDEHGSASLLGSWNAYMEKDEKKDDRVYTLKRNPKYSRCCASDCMMWRWETNDRYIATGYCGLGGK